MNDKPYIKYLDEISAQKLYDGLLGDGLFAETLPPVFTSKPFLRYCKDKSPGFPKDPTPYVQYECSRNNLETRPIGIPNPFSYEHLCQHLSRHWDDLRAFFRVHTANQTHKISRLHIRSINGSDKLFKMSYHSLRENCNPIVPQIISNRQFEARYVVQTDVAKCFPSIYSHALVWALRDKKWAKEHRDEDDLWENKTDILVRNLKYGETNGLLIGPHASNLLADIVLTRVDEELCTKFSYIRNIDDCKCFVPSRENGEKFVIEQNVALKKYGLSQNSKKTAIRPLPIGAENGWVRRLNNYVAQLPQDRLELGHIRSLLDYVIELLEESHDAAVISYTLAMVKDRELTRPARDYYVQTVLHFAAIYTYLYRFLDERVLQPFSLEAPLLKALIDRMIRHGLEIRNYEEVSYALYFSVRYDLQIKPIDLSLLITIDDCVLLTMVWVYCRHWQLPMEDLVKRANLILSEEMSFWENWLFAYEVLPADRLKKVANYGESLYALKKSKVSFVLPDNDISAVYSESLSARWMRWDVSLEGSDEAMLQIDQFYQSLIGRVPGYPGTILRSYLLSVLANLFAGRMLGFNLKIACSQRSYDEHNIVDFESNRIDVKIVKEIRRWMEKSGIVCSNSGRDVYWASGRLNGLFAKLTAKDIRLRSTMDHGLVELRDSSGAQLALNNSEEVPAFYLSKIRMINDAYARHAYVFEPGRGMCAQPFHVQLRAIFNNGSWEQGGRLYPCIQWGSVNYQELSKEVRSTIRIDGKNTVERDFQGMHLAMLYARCGKQLTGDPYDIGDPLLRPLTKKLVNAALNASSRESVLASVRQDCESLRGMEGLSCNKRGLLSAYEQNSDLEWCLKSIVAKHPLIEKYLYSGVGLKLQAVDSRIAVDVVSCFCERNIAVLPVHDSFIIDEQYGDELKAQMRNIFKKHTGGFECVIK